MIATDGSRPAPEEGSGPGGRGRVRPLVVLGVAAFVAMVAFWGWAFGRSIAQRDTPAASRNPDYLDDRDWVARAEETCAATMAVIDERTRPAGEQEADERAGDIDTSTDEVEVMLAALRDPLPATEADREVVVAWLADWDQLVADRRTYADALRTDPDARFLTIEKFNDPLDRVVEIFADVNDMPSCGPAGDVG